jgi:hypothetical protein
MTAADRKPPTGSESTDATGGRQADTEPQYERPATFEASDQGVLMQQAKRNEQQQRQKEEPYNE